MHVIGLVLIAVALAPFALLGLAVALPLIVGLALLIVTSIISVLVIPLAILAEIFKKNKTAGKKR